MPEWLIGAVSKTVVRLLAYRGFARTGARWANPHPGDGEPIVYYVYVLRSEGDGRLYTGVTGNLERRLGEHKRGRVRSTAGRRPLALVYSEGFATKHAAMQRERFFKTAEGGALKQRLIEESHSGTLE